MGTTFRPDAGLFRKTQGQPPSLQRKSATAPPPVYRPTNPTANAPAVYRPNTAVSLQQKPVIAAPTVYRPSNPAVTAPAVYRPNAGGPLQQKGSGNVAPPVYRVDRPITTAPATYPAHLGASLQTHKGLVTLSSGDRHPANTQTGAPSAAAPATNLPSNHQRRSPNKLDHHSSRVQQTSSRQSVQPYSNQARRLPGATHASPLLASAGNFAVKQKLASDTVIQRVSRVFTGNMEIKETDTNGPRVFEALNALTNFFEGEVWFNSSDEMVAWIRSLGKLEGIGVWNGRWMNFSGKGPIVFGEEHNDIRMQFIHALNIKHYVVEGAFERSLAGVEAKNIPAHSTSSRYHQLYSGDEHGKALENFWTRSAQGMARFWREFEQNLSQIDPDHPHLPQVERLGELQELIKTIKGSWVKPGTGSGIPQSIQIQLDNARFHLQKTEQAGLGRLLDIMKLDRVPYRLALKELIKRIEIVPLQFAFSEFRKCIEMIGYLNFTANASKEELELDERSKHSTDPFKVWGGRREHFMLKNLKTALSKNPPPLLTTIGAAHARNQQEAIRELLRPYGGKLIIGSIVDLADVGAINDTRQQAEAISIELSSVYGWSESYRRKFATSAEANEMAKIRVGNAKQPSPSYIS